MPHVPRQTAKTDGGKLRKDFDRLTTAEREVVLWLCRGFLDDESIGKRLKRSPNTVRTQIGSIFQKLGLHSRGDVLSVLRHQTTTPQAGLTPIGTYTSWFVRTERSRKPRPGGPGLGFLG